MESGEPIDDRLEKANQHHAALGQIELSPVATPEQHRKGARLGIGTVKSRLPTRINVAGVTFTSVPSPLKTKVAVMKKLPSSWYSLLDTLISFCSRASGRRS